jgi:hypothetical protein
MTLISLAFTHIGGGKGSDQRVPFPVIGRLEVVRTAQLRIQKGSPSLGLHEPERFPQTSYAFKP